MSKTDRIRRGVAKILATALSLFLVASAHAQWKVLEYKDAMTDRISPSAIARSKEGHTLMVARSPDGTVSMSFHLNDTTQDLIEAGSVMRYRIDENTSFALPYSWKPRFVIMKLWHGKTELGRNDELIQLMSGQRLLVRYSIFNGGSRDIEYSLEGARDAITSALGLQTAVENGTLEKVEVENAMAEVKKKVRMELAERCRANAVKEDYSVCMARGR